MTEVEFNGHIYEGRYSNSPTSSRAAGNRREGGRPHKPNGVTNGHAIFGTLYQKSKYLRKMNFMTMENPNLSGAGYPQNQQLRSKRPKFVPLLPTACRANEDSRTSTKCTGDGHLDLLGNNTSANTVPASNSSVPTKLTLSALQIGNLGGYSGRTVLPVSTRAIWNSGSTLEFDRNHRSVLQRQSNILRRQSCRLFVFDY